MFGALISLIVAAGAAGMGLAVSKRPLESVEPITRWSVSGLIGLGALGLLSFFLGLLPNGFRWGLWVILALALAGLFVLWRELRGNTKMEVPKGPALLFPAGIVVAVLVSFVGVLAPSDTLDWDSLAYHLAVPKMWIEAGQWQFVSFIHHSNFPFTIDNLYVWGLQWGGQHGAKAFSLAYLIFGLGAIFGLGRQLYGGNAGWWGALAFVSIPAVLWLSGTAYIDVSNGLYAGLGILFAALLVADPGKRGYALISAILLGFAAGSKYTGLQTVFAVGLVLLLYGLFGKGAATKALVPRAFLVGLLAIAIASPWYVKNAATTGNPVYPFFYSVFGGKNWDTFSSAIYTEEQKTFGVGAGQKSDPTQIGHAVLGLAYQPGRYTNPSPTQGTGMPLGALGVVALCAGLLWCYSGKITRLEGFALATIGISLLMWFFLSQQSRYIVALAVPLSVLAGGAVVRLRAGPILAGVTVLQTLYTLWLLNVAMLSHQLPVAFGKVSQTEYLAQRTGFFEPSAVVNIAAKNGKVALYDEVFGFFLDVPYFWANPGHTTELGYDQMENGQDLIAAFRRLGITHVYLNLGIYSPQDPTFQRWSRAMGLQDGIYEPYEGEERAQMSSDLRNKWKVLVADAIENGEMVPVEHFRRSILFALK